MEHIY